MKKSEQARVDAVTRALLPSFKIGDRVRLKSEECARKCGLFSVHGMLIRGPMVINDGPSSRFVDGEEKKIWFFSCEEYTHLWVSEECITHWRKP